MKEIKIHKITVNMGVGESGDNLKKAMQIMEKITGKKPVQTSCKVKIPTWGIREGLNIGTKVTLRKKDAEEFLKKAFLAKENEIRKKNFDNHGNFGFGIKEYIDLPDTKYDPKLGIRGLDVLVTLERPGYRIKRRKIRKRKIVGEHAINRNEAIDYVKNRFGVEVIWHKTRNIHKNK